jgi:hypothetical protein
MTERNNNQEGQGKHDSPNLLAESINAALGYQEYLENFKDRPRLTGCSGPMTQEEFVNVQTKIVEPLEQLAELANKAINNKKTQ